MRRSDLALQHVTFSICRREMERDRVVDQEGMLYNQFNSANDFELIEKYARVIAFDDRFSQRPFRCSGFERAALE